MSTAKTTADLFRERGWGVGTKVMCCTSGPYTVLLVHGRVVVMTDPADSDEITFWSIETDWSIYRPAPPVPTEKEWRELWAKLEAWRNERLQSGPLHAKETAEMIRVVDTLKAKVQP